ncbi:MAG: bifunctional uroporphyrinogen-III C-methyltransferase/uroporphyrinogen-III synthase [Dehalococcoidia bacterium]
MSARQRRPASNLQSPTPSTGKVWLVGAGPGDPGLITVAGLERLREADVVVYDRLVSPRLLDHIRQDAERVYMGKTPQPVILSEAKPALSGVEGDLGESQAVPKAEILRRSGPLPAASAPQNDMLAHDQAAINQLLVARAREGKRVVRLKGGDPFVFGRGGEEAEALRAAGVPFEVVPGVTSAVAVPAYAGIPVTHRGLASSFAVVTGHEADPVILSGDDVGHDPDSGDVGHVPSRDTAIDWARLATAVDTLVLLMGVRTLPAIIEKLIAAGRPADTPAAVIERGTTPDQRTVTGALADIVARAEEAGIGAPAITVVGEVVRLRDTLAWFEQQPLLGKRVLITRTRRQASVLARLLADEGAVPIELPAIEIEPSYDESAVAAAIDKLVAGGYAWCVFTSANAVDVWFGLMRERTLDARGFGATRVAAIGPATAEALSERGITADAVPAEYIAESLVEALSGSVILSGDSGLARDTAGSRRNLGRGSGRSSSGLLRPGDRILLPRAESARPELVEGLRRLGAEVDEVTLYRAALPAEAPAEALSLLRDGGVDIVTFTSSSTVRNLAALLGDDFPVILSGDGAGATQVVSSRRNLGGATTAERRTTRTARPLIACIGPITAATARELGLPVDVEAAEHTVRGLVAAVRERYGE